MPNGAFKDSFRLSDYIAGSYGVIFFYPLDFNYISLTELLSLQKRMADFAALDAKVVVLSCDSHLAHQAWRQMPSANNCLGATDFPMIADMTRDVAHLFDVLVAEAIPEAATIIVDRESKVIFQTRHDTAIGRNINRVLEVIKIYENDGRAPSAPIDQILLLEKNAANFARLGCPIVAQSVDTDLNHPQWNRLPRDGNGQPHLSFPFLAGQQPWPQHEGMTLAVREGLEFHSTGLLMADRQLLFEHHADRRIPRDFVEILRIVDAIRHHQTTGEVVPWEIAA